MSKKILILGGSGYIGTRLSYLLSEKYDDITILDLETNLKLNNSKIKYINCDITKQNVIDKITDQFYNVVINLISLDYKKSQCYNPIKVNNINVLPTWNLLNSFTKKNNLEKFINFSTIHVYSDFLEKNIIKEDSKINPSSIYGLTHFMTENIVNYFNNKSKISSINLRLSNSYGEPYLKNNDCWNLVVNNLCLNAFKFGKIELKSSLKNTRNFIHYLDIFNAVNLLINSDNIKYNNYNLCNDKSISFAELVEIIKYQYEFIFGKKLIVLVLNKSLKIQNLHYSNSRLKKIKFKNNISIEYGINKIFHHLKDEYKRS